MAQEEQGRRCLVERFHMLRSLGKTEPLDFRQGDVGGSKMDGIICFGLFDLFAFSSVCLLGPFSVFLAESFLSLHFTSLLHSSAYSFQTPLLTCFLSPRTSACTGLWLAMNLKSVSIQPQGLCFCDPCSVWSFILHLFIQVPKMVLLAHFIFPC